MKTMTNHPNRGLRYALVIADPGSDELGRIVSRHRTIKAAGIALSKLPNDRWAYVAEKRADGSYPLRVEAMDLPAHQSAEHERTLHVMQR